MGNFKLRRKLTLEVPQNFFEQARQIGVRPLPITWVPAHAVKALPPQYADPFGRLLIAQAQCESLTLLSTDSRIAPYAADRL